MTEMPGDKLWRCDAHNKRFCRECAEAETAKLVLEARKGKRK